MLQSTKLEGVGDLKSALTSDMEKQSLECVLLVLGLALFTMLPPFLTFGIIMYSLCHCMLGVCDLLPDFLGGTVKRLIRDILNFELLNSVETEKHYRAF